MARGRKNTSLSSPRYSPSPERSIQVVSSGTVAKPKPFRVGKRRSSVVQTRIVQAPGQSGTI